MMGYYVCINDKIWVRKMDSLLILSTLLIALVLHEACHALALKSIGATIHTFQIGTPVIFSHGVFSLGLIPLFGGVQADLSGFGSIKKAWYWAAGPIGSIFTGVIFSLCGIWLNIYFLKLLGVVNLVFGIFNLIPVPPLDGFRLLTMGRQVSYPVQVVWAIAGWALLAAITFWFAD